MRRWFPGGLILLLLLVLWDHGSFQAKELLDPTYDYKQRLADCQ